MDFNTIECMAAYTLQIGAVRSKSPVLERSRRSQEMKTPPPAAPLLPTNSFCTRLEQRATKAARFRSLHPALPRAIFAV